MALQDPTIILRTKISTRRPPVSIFPANPFLLDTADFSSKTSMTTVAKIPGYAYLGCFVDKPNRLLDGAFNSDNNSMTASFCLSYCNGISPARFYPLIGLEFASQCYCGGSFTQVPEPADDASCKSSCTGNSSEVCGATWFIGIYNATTAPAGHTLATA